MWKFALPEIGSRFPPPCPPHPPPGPSQPSAQLGVVGDASEVAERCGCSDRTWRSIAFLNLDNRGTGFASALNRCNFSAKHISDTDSAVVPPYNHSSLLSVFDYTDMTGETTSQQQSLSFAMVRDPYARYFLSFRGRMEATCWGGPRDDAMWRDVPTFMQSICNEYFAAKINNSTLATAAVYARYLMRRHDLYPLGSADFDGGFPASQVVRRFGQEGTLLGRPAHVHVADERADPASGRGDAR